MDFGRQNYDQILIALGGLRIGKKFGVKCGRAAYEACKAKSILDNNSAFALEPRKTTENLRRFGLSQDFLRSTLTCCQQSDVLRV